MNELANKKALVIGLGISGRSAVSFLLRKKALVTGVDNNLDLLHKNPELQSLSKKGLKTYHESENINVENFDLIVVSPGVPESHPLYKKAREKNLEIVGEVELACRYIKGTFLGITGTNGKTTVTLLVTHVLNQNGKPAYALGNSGVALTSEDAEKAMSENAIIVAELSSYQLDTMHTQVIDAAVLLNITPDHLDRYHTMENYAKSKWHIQDCVKAKGVFYAEESSWKEFGHLLKGAKPKLYGYSADCQVTSDLTSLIIDNKKMSPLPDSCKGKQNHDLENLMAAYALCSYVGITPEQFMSAFATFKKPSHRIEYITTLDGVLYYDDSKGTNLDAVIRAVNSLPGHMVLIAGGVDKGAAYTPWIAAFENKVKCVCAIGQAAPKIEKDIGHAIPVKLFHSLEEAVRHAANLAKSGEIVLLSPGCSSFDMFKDYAHRGEEFQRIVKQLQPVGLK